MTATKKRLLKGLSLLKTCGPLGERGSRPSNPTATPHTLQEKIHPFSIFKQTWQIGRQGERQDALIFASQMMPAPSVKTRASSATA